MPLDGYKVTCQSKTRTGVESRCRWTDQKHGQVSSAGVIGQPSSGLSKTRIGVWYRCTRQSETETGMESLTKDPDRCRM